MSTNATLRNNLAKRGSNILCGNIVNKEKEINPVQKKTSILNHSLLNGNSTNFNTNSLNSNLTNNGKNGVFSKLDTNKAKIASKKENNENDKNANNIFLKRKTTIDLDNNNNAKKQLNNNSYLNLHNKDEKDQIRISVKNQNLESNTEMNMNVSMKESNKNQQLMSENTEMATEEANTTGYVLTINEMAKTHRNPVIDPKRRSLPLVSSETSQIIAKSLQHGEIKKRPVIVNNANPNANNNNASIISGNCDEFAFESINAENSNANSHMVSNVPNSKLNSITNNANINNNNINGAAVNLIPSNANNPNANNPNSHTNANSKLNFKSLISSISLNNNSSSTNSLNIPASLYSFNLENISISKEQTPKFTNDEYRRMFTRLIRKDLGRSYINNLFCEEEQMDDFLLHHKVTERMRTRMIDWMIEVLTNYKCDDNTLFLAVNTMDRYFKGLNENSVQPADLHLIGVAAMFMASKYEDIYPLRLKIVHEKIAHKKLSCLEIKEKETDISVGLGFILGKPTQWDFINFFIEEIFFTQVNNFAVQDKTLCENYGTAMGTGPNPNSLNSNNNLQQNFSQYETEIFKNYTANMINLLRHVVVYLAKMNCHDYSLSGKKPSLIAASTIFVAMKICEQINKEEYVNEYFSKKLTEISQKNENEIIKTSQKILYNAQNFDSIFTGLENLKKIHFNAIIDLKNTK